MKKYVKPMMESEAFVANEYVSACRTLDCSGCGAHLEGYETMKSQVVSKDFKIYEESVYLGQMIGGDNDGVPCKEYNVPNEEPELTLNPNTWWPWLAWQIFIEILGFDPGNKEEIDYHSQIKISSGWKYTTNHPNSSI